MRVRGGGGKSATTMRILLECTRSVSVHCVPSAYTQRTSSIQFIMFTTGRMRPYFGGAPPPIWWLTNASYLHDVTKIHWGTACRMLQKYSGGRRACGHVRALGVRRHAALLHLAGARVVELPATVDGRQLHLRASRKSRARCNENAARVPSIAARTRRASNCTTQQTHTHTHSLSHLGRRRRHGQRLHHLNRRVRMRLGRCGRACGASARVRRRLGRIAAH